MMIKTNKNDDALDLNYLDNKAFIALIETYSREKGLGFSNKSNITIALDIMQEESKKYQSINGEPAKILVYSHLSVAPNLFSIIMPNAYFTGVMLNKDSHPVSVPSQISRVTHIAKSELFDKKNKKKFAYAGLIMGFPENIMDSKISELSELLIPDSKILQLFDYDADNSVFTTNVYHDSKFLIPINVQCEFLSDIAINRSND